MEAALKVYSRAGSWKLAEAILSCPALLGEGKADRLSKVMDVLTVQVPPVFSLYCGSHLYDVRIE